MVARLSDDLTSWHVTASAVTGSLQAGVGELLVPVGLPFFVEATIADSYLVSDQPAIQLRAFGSGLAAGDAVEFTVSSSTLGIAPTKVDGSAFQPVWFSLPKLALGRQTLDIAATTARTDAAGKPLADRLLGRFEVVESRLTQVRTTYATLGASLAAPSETAGLTTYTFTDAGRGRYSRTPARARPASRPAGRSDARPMARPEAPDRRVRVRPGRPAAGRPGRIGLPERQDGGRRTAT